MFDLGLSEVLLVATVALIVLGPERLPRVAHAAGRLWGKTRSLVYDAKSRISEQINPEEWRDWSNAMRRDMEDGLRKLERQISDAGAGNPSADAGETAWQRLPETRSPEDFAQRSLHFHRRRNSALQRRRQTRFQLTHQRKKPRLRVRRRQRSR